MNANTSHILAIELLAAADGIDFHRPLESSPRLEAAHAALRARVPRFLEDRAFSPAIEAAQSLVSERSFEPLLIGTLSLPSASA
jgi:histidine ammonia-lyase